MVASMDLGSCIEIIGHVVRARDVLVVFQQHVSGGEDSRILPIYTGGS
jgi:hypothetical protein